MATSTDRVWVGTRKGAFVARRSGNGWKLDPPLLAGQPTPYVAPDPRTGSTWASIDHGHWGVKLARQRDGGGFEEVAPPKYPEATGQAASYYWVLAPGPADAPETFYVGTEPGGLFTTRDDGATWRLDETLWSLREEHDWQGGGRDRAGIHSICIDPGDPDHIYVGVSCAGVLETKDGGSSWGYVNRGCTHVFPDMGDREYGFDPHCVVLAPSEARVLWQQSHTGVFRSTDGAASWTEVSAKPLVHFGFPVAVHPARPDTAWVVPMQSDGQRTTVDGKLRVMRTDDGGARWREQTAGLPQEAAWDFPFRHGLDVGADGETLVFGTTSGNLYASDDGGESWAVISHNLPPVYSVRFA